MRGRLFIRRPTLASQLGRIHLLDRTVENMTAGQAEVVAVGPADTDEDAKPLDPRVVPGAWVLTRFRNWIEVADDCYAIRHEDVIGVFIEYPDESSPQTLPPAG